VTCLLSDAPDDVIPADSYDIALGEISAAKGAFTGFEITVDGYAALEPSGRGAARFGEPVKGAKSTCDIILDLTGGDSLFPAPEKRDGYLRADPRDHLAVQTALLEASTLVGEFDKPLYIRFDPQICAHSRASQSGCNRCLDVCPTGAILPDGDTVSIDPDICAGCGACASVCPSGAASYEDPTAQFMFQRLRTLASAYKEAGGSAPVCLYHDTGFGAELIQMSARFGKGLPADVIPVGVSNIESVGHAEVLAALGVGFSNVTILASPKSDLGVVEGQIQMAQAVLGAGSHDVGCISLLDVSDPYQLDEALVKPFTEIGVIESILPLGNRRDVTRLAAFCVRWGRSRTIRISRR